MAKGETRFRSKLLDLSLDSTHPRYHHAAIIAKGKSLIAEGVNHSGVHAEEDALRMAEACGAEVKGATLYTLMLKVKSGRLGDGSPCKTCMEAITAAKLRRVVVYL